jgi:hypothetical protein
VAQSCGAPEEALSCATGPAGDAAVEQMAKETPPHPGWGLILVDFCQWISQDSTMICEASEAKHQHIGWNFRMKMIEAYRIERT